VAESNERELIENCKIYKKLVTRPLTGSRGLVFQLKIFFPLGGVFVAIKSIFGE
jgi:hypothetical protein